MISVALDELTTPTARLEAVAAIAKIDRKLTSADVRDLLRITIRAMDRYVQAGVAADDPAYRELIVQVLTVDRKKLKKRHIGWLGYSPMA